MLEIFKKSNGSGNGNGEANKELRWMKDQPKTTYFGYEITPIKTGLPKTVDSLCPDCKKIIPAILYEEDGKVWMTKECPEHGEIQDLFFSDVDMYYKAERMWYGDQRGLENPKVKSATVCPEHCGLCNMHTSVSSLPIIDLTNRCNLTCPVCFANANAAGYLYEPTYDEVVRMLETLLTQKPVASDRVQFSGGEPTVHPNFLKIVKTAHDMGFEYIQVNTNGIKSADLEFAQACKEAGVESFYLQFDGIDDAIFKKTRGEPLLEYKFKTIENARKVGLSVILVDTVINGLNNHHVGRVLQLAIDNYDVVKGVAYQPVSLTGRITKKQRMAMRYTLGDLAHDVEKQTGYVNAKEDWFPMACSVPLGRLVGALKGKPSLTVSCHPHCSMGTYLFLEKGTGRVVPVSRFVDMEGLLNEVNDISSQIKPGSNFSLLSQAKAFLRLKKYFKQENAPKGLTFEGFLKTLDGYENKTRRRVNLGKFDGYPSVFAAGMHFMDNYNYSIERVRRCVIHYVTPNGFIYPFCTYNTGMVFRERTESRYRLAAEQVIEKMKAENFPKELKQLAKKMKINVEEVRAEAASGGCCGGETHCGH
jgi:uncharacterized radical SAM superfamily Fe-S cluster-containing enzyme